MTSTIAPRPKLPPREGELRAGTRLSGRQRLTRAAFGRNPIGMLFGAPYVLTISSPNTIVALWTSRVGSTR